MVNQLHSLKILVQIYSSHKELQLGWAQQSHTLLHQQFNSASVSLRYYCTLFPSTYSASWANVILLDEQSDSKLAV